MSDLIVPASLWRRFAAAVYDSLLLVGIWMGTALIYVPLRDVVASPTSNNTLPVFLFLTGLAFFGWCWTHGGQTPGMLAWHLQVRRSDGESLRWPVSATRYALLLFCWGIAITPVLLFLPEGMLAKLPHAARTAAIGITATFANAIFAMRDARKRLLCDRLTSTEVVGLPLKTGR